MNPPNNTTPIIPYIKNTSNKPITKSQLPIIYNNYNNFPNTYNTPINNY